MRCWRRRGLSFDYSCYTCRGNEDHERVILPSHRFRSESRGRNPESTKSFLQYSSSCSQILQWVMTSLSLGFPCLVEDSSFLLWIRASFEGVLLAILLFLLPLTLIYRLSFASRSFCSLPPFYLTPLLDALNWTEKNGRENHSGYEGIEIDNFWIIWWISDLRNVLLKRMPLFLLLS